MTTPFVCACGTLPAVPGRRPAGLRAPAPARASRTGARSPSWSLVARAPTSTSSPLPDEVDVVTAAALGCRFATAFRAVVQVGRVARRRVGRGARLRRRRAVRGDGRRRRPAPGWSPSTSRRARWRWRAALGAERAVDARPGDVAVAAVRALTGGGARRLARRARQRRRPAPRRCACLRPRGRHVQVGLLPACGPARRCRWTGDRRASSSCSAATGWPRRGYPELLGPRRRRPPATRRGWSTARIGLDDAGPALAAMGDAPPTGITVAVP